MKTFTEVIESIKQIKNITTDTDVAKSLGIGIKAFALRKMRNSTPLQAILKFCEKEGISADIVLFRREDRTDGERTFLVSEASIGYGDFVFIPQITGKISAGGGLIPDNTVEMKIAFRRDWIQRKGRPDQMSLIRVLGDSMEPTLESGDIVLIDHSRDYVDPHGGIYAIAVNGEIMLKRLQTLYPFHKIKIISDNPKYDPLELDPNKIKINGKVIWFGRELER